MDCWLFMFVLSKSVKKFEVSAPTMPIPAEVSNSLEAEDDYYKMLLEDCAKDCVYFDKEIDSTSQSVKKTNKEAVLQSGGETNESKSDNDSDSDDSEEEMPDDSDDDEHWENFSGVKYR